MSDYPGKLVPEDLANFYRERLTEEEALIGFAKDAGVAVEPLAYNRLIADLQAKRELVDEWLSAEHLARKGIYHDHVPDGYRAAFRRLASVYSGHSDYDPGWAP